MTNGKQLGFGPSEPAIAGVRAKYSHQALWESLTVTVVALCAVGRAFLG